MKMTNNGILPKTNTILKFIGYYAEYKDGKIYAYEINGDYKTSCNLTTTSELVTFTFNDKNGNKVWYTAKKDKDSIIHTLNIGDNNIRFTEARFSDDNEIDIDTFYQNKTYGSKMLTVKRNYFKAMISTPAWGIIRSIDYDDYKLESHMVEFGPLLSTTKLNVTRPKVGYCVWDFISSSGTGKIEMRDTFDAIKSTENIILHPRNKELIEFATTGIDETFPGIIDYIKENFKMYDAVLDREYAGNHKVTYLIDTIINHDCDIPKECFEKKKTDE